MRAAGWEFKGELTEGRSAPCGDWDMGAMWECPFLLPLPPPPPTPRGDGSNASPAAAADRAHGARCGGAGDPACGQPGAHVRRAAGDAAGGGAGGSWNDSAAVDKSVGRGPGPSAAEAGANGIRLSDAAGEGGSSAAEGAEVGAVGRATGGAAGGAGVVHVLCVSPYPHTAAERPTNPCLYWLGTLTPDDKFLIEQASGARQRC